MSSLLEAIATWTAQREIGISQIRRHRLADDYRHSTLPIQPFEILTIRVDYQLAARLTP